LLMLKWERDDADRTELDRVSSLVIMDTSWYFFML